MMQVLSRANLEDGSARAIRSLLHREMTGKISARSAQMAMERIVPKLEPASIVPPINLDEYPHADEPGSVSECAAADLSRRRRWQVHARRCPQSHDPDEGANGGVKSGLPETGAVQSLHRRRRRSLRSASSW